MGKGVWWATVHRVAQSLTRLKWLSTHVKAQEILGQTVVQLLSHVRLFVTPCIAALQAPLSFSISKSLLKFVSLESVILSNHFMLCCLPSVFPSIRVFSSQSSLRIDWPNYWSVNFSISPSNDYWSLISFRVDFPLGLISLRCKELWRVFFCSTTIQKHQFFGTQPFLWTNFHICTWLLKNRSFDYMDLYQQSDISAF